MNAKRTSTVSACLAAVACLAASVAAATPAAARVYAPAPSRLLVVGAHGLDPDRAGGPLDAADVDAVDVIESLDIAVVESADPAAVERLERRLDVAAVVPDEIVATALDRSVPAIGADVYAGTANDGRGRTIAILDDGFDFSHVTFTGLARQEACFTAGDGTCPNGLDTQIGPGAAASTNGSTHGTAVAAVAVGRGGDGVAPGVAPGASVIAVNPFGTTASARASSILLALDHVHQLGGVDAVNLSLEFRGAHYPSACDDDSSLAQLFADAFELLDADGAVVTVASGNESSTAGVSLPACIDIALAVGATVEYGDGDTSLWSGTDRGPNLDLLAPGALIESARVGGGSTIRSGTSFSAPHVAGAAAVLRSLYPSSSSRWLRAVLTRTGKPVSVDGVTYPRLDLARASVGTGLWADDRADAVTLSGTSGRGYAGTLGATREVGELDHGGGLTAGSVWYRYTPSRSGTLVIDSSSSTFGTAVTVYNESGAGALVARGSAAATTASGTTIAADIPGGDTVLVAIDGVGGQRGALEFSWRFTASKPSRGDSVAVRRGTIWFERDQISSGFHDRTFSYGAPEGRPIAGDWDGDGIDTPGVIVGRTFYLRNTNTAGPADIVVTYGRPGDLPLVGDWNGDGIDTLGVRRNNVFYLRNTNRSGVADLTIGYGKWTDTPIVGDFDGDGIDTLGIRRNNAYYLRNSNTTGIADLSYGYGKAADAPVVGDWDGDGIDTAGVRRGGQYFLRNTNTSGPADIVFTFGDSGDQPVVGNWDGT